MSVNVPKTSDYRFLSGCQRDAGHKKCSIIPLGSKFPQCQGTGVLEDSKGVTHAWFYSLKIP